MSLFQYHLTTLNVLAGSVFISKHGKKKLLFMSLVFVPLAVVVLYGVFDRFFRCLAVPFFFLHKKAAYQKKYR